MSVVSRCLRLDVGQKKILVREEMSRFVLLDSIHSTSRISVSSENETPAQTDRRKFDFWVNGLFDSKSMKAWGATH